MKKQNLKDEPVEEDIPRKIPWSKLGEMNLNEIKKIIAKHDRVLIYSVNGDYFELTELEL